MLLWQKHRPLPEEDVVQLEKEILDIRGGKLEDVYYTNYPLECEEDRQDSPKNTHKEFYSSIIQEMVIDMGLNFGPRSVVEPHWFQMYNSDTCTHELHDHFKLSEDIMCLISWVHIIKDVPDEQDCFYFKNHRGQQLSPQPQSAGWVFAFPSWQAHGVRSITTPGVNRIIAAGNLAFQIAPCTTLTEEELYEEKED